MGASHSLRPWRTHREMKTRDFLKERLSDSNLLLTNYHRPDGNSTLEEVDCRPPNWAENPYRGGIYDPVIDDGVKVNLMPLQKGEVLRYKRMI